MLESVKIARRQSEIRQNLAELAAKETPSEDEVRSMDELDREYRQNETRYRAALIAEDTERRDAGSELETRSEQEWADLMAGFEMRQVALALDEGRQLDGQTAEIVTELREQGGVRVGPAGEKPAVWQYRHDEQRDCRTVRDAFGHVRHADHRRGRRCPAVHRRMGRG